MIEKFDQAKEFFKQKKFIINDDILKATLVAIKQGKVIWAVGPTGSGKTDFFQLLSEFLGGTYHYQSLNGSYTIDDLTEERVIGKNGTFEENDMILASWLRDANKGISFLQLDEINAAKPETLLALHPIMDLKKKLVLKFSKEELIVNNNAIMVLSCNEGDEYHGINALNAAFINRMGIKIHFEYVQGLHLVNLLVEKTNVTVETATSIKNIWEKYMSARTPEQPIIGTRVLMHWANFSKDLGLKTAGKFSFAGLITNNKDELDEVIEGDFFVHLKD